jgi:hypothetical protein
MQGWPLRHKSRKFRRFFRSALLTFPSPQCFFSISTAKNKEKSENVKENQKDENEEHGACNVVSSKSGINKKNKKKKKMGRRNKSGLPN